MPPAIVKHPNAVRGPIESKHNTLIAAREKKFVTDKVALENTFHSEMATLKAAKEAELTIAGLNKDGSPKDDYPAGVTFPA